MKNIHSFISEYPSLSTILCTLLCVVLTFIVPDLKTKVPIGTYEMFFLKLGFVFIATIIMIGVLTLLSWMHQLILCDLFKLSKSRGINILWALNSKSFIDKYNDNKIWCTKESYSPKMKCKDYVCIHRIDGPAIENMNNNEIKWYLYNEEYTFERFLKCTPINDKKKQMLIGDYPELLI